MPGLFVRAKGPKHQQGGYVLGAPDNLCVMPAYLYLARAVVAAALTNDWGFEGGDVEGA